MVSISPCTVIWLSVVSTIMYMLSCGFDAVCVVDIYVAPWLIGFLTRGRESGYKGDPVGNAFPSLFALSRTLGPATAALRKV